jgi:hypothetical protein
MVTETSASASKLARTEPCTAAAIAPITTYGMPSDLNRAATSIINSADCPGALARMARSRLQRSRRDRLSGTIQRRHQLAMRQKCVQTLFRGHAAQLRG